MLATVKLNNQSSFYAAEINNIRRHGHLTPELVPQQPPVSQKAPELLFGPGHFKAQTAGMIQSRFGQGELFGF